MQKLNSISLMVMGTGFLLLALIMDNFITKSVALVLSIILNIIAIVKNFKEKKENKL